MERLKVGILGLGRGLSHLHDFLNVERARVIGVADRLPARRARAQERLQGTDVRIVNEYEDLLELGLDAIVVATNGRLQAEHSIQALEAGMAVLSEVPGGFTQQELVRLKDTVERTGGFYMLGENACFWDFFRYWRKWIAQDRFGPISIAEGEYLHYLPHTLVTPDGEFLTPSEARAAGRTNAVPTWRADQPPIQYLTHDLGPLLEVLDDRIVSVSARSAPWRNPETPLRSDGQIGLFETAKGTLIKIMVTLSTHRPGEHRYRIFGTKGGVEAFGYEGFCRRFGPERREQDGWEKVLIGLASDEDRGVSGHGGADIQVGRAFVRAVLDGQPSPIDIYRTVEYSLPGIIADQSAALGGAPLPVPDFRPRPYSGTIFWDAVGLPDKEPPVEPFATASVW